MLKVMLGNILLKFVDLLCITMCHLVLKMYQMFVVESYQILFVCYILLLSTVPDYFSFKDSQDDSESYIWNDQSPFYNWLTTSRMMNGTALTAALHSPPHGQAKNFSPPAKAGTIYRTQKDGRLGEHRAWRVLPRTIFVKNKHNLWKAARASQALSVI